MADLSLEERFDVLEQRLRQAESAIYGCRAMLNYCRRIERESEPVQIETSERRKGLYPGQYDNYVAPEDPEYEECVD